MKSCKQREFLVSLWFPSVPVKQNAALGNLLLTSYEKNFPSINPLFYFFLFSHCVLLSPVSEEGMNTYLFVTAVSIDIFIH